MVRLPLRRLVRVPLLLAGLALLGGAEAPPPGQAAKPDPFLPLRRLLGKWQGDISGRPGNGKAEREYSLTLNNRFIRVDNKSTYEPQEKNPKGEVHEDLGYLSYDKAQKKLVLRQFHVEGFVNHYVLESLSEDGRTIVFLTTAIENIPAGFRARETWQMVSDDEFVEIFALAEPGKDFQTYSETRFRRKK